MASDAQWWREKYPEELWPLFEDFRVFLAHVWNFLNLPEPTLTQYLIASYLQHGPKRFIIEAFRGVGKSWITSAYVCWLLLRDPQLNIMVVSASKDRSDNFTTFTLRLITEVPVLKHLTPRRDQRCSKVAFDVGPADADHAPSVRSVGITGQMTGGRADIIIADDIEVPNNSATQTMRDMLAERVKEFDAILKPGGRIGFLGTPQTEQSVYNTLEERGYITRIWPARYPSERHLTAYSDRLCPTVGRMLESDPTLGGRPTDPKRFDDNDLLEREASYGRSGFDLQFMLNTALSDLERYPLRLQDLIVADIDVDMGPEKIMWASSPELIINDLPNVGFNGDRYHRPMGYARDAGGAIRLLPWGGSVLVIDPSGRGADESGYCVAKMLNSQIFVPAAGGKRGHGYDDKVLTFYAELAKKHKVNLILIEANFGDGMFSQLLKPYLKRIYPCTVEEVKHSIQKEKRIIDTLEPVMNQHRLIVDPKVIDDDFRSTSDIPTEKANHYRLFHQMTRITNQRGALVHDDRLDALAIAVAYWAEQMAVDVEDALTAEMNEAAERAYEKFIEAATRQHSNLFNHQSDYADDWIDLP